MAEPLALTNLHRPTTQAFSLGYANGWAFGPRNHRCQSTSIQELVRFPVVLSNHRITELQSQKSMNNSAATIECGQYIGRAKLLLSRVSRGIQLGGSLAVPVLKPLLEKAGSFSVSDRRFRAG
jgi:hypothetical protein